MPEWKEWKPCEGTEKGKSFHCLRELFIKNCPKLVKTLPGCLPCLEKLVVNECHQLVVSISNFPMLSELEIDRCKELVLGSSIDIWSVKTVYLLNISRFSCATKEMAMLKSMNVENLHVNVCQELASLWQTKWGWLAPLTSLHNLRFQNCRQVVSIGAAKEGDREELLQLEMPYNIEHVRIEDCQGLENLSKTSHNLARLTELEIVKCPKLVSIPMDNLPLTLKNLVIGSCENSQCLLEDRENIKSRSTVALESLRVGKCEALKLLSSSGKLPMRLKSLDIHGCPELEFVAHGLENNTCLNSILVRYCQKIRYLPEGMDKLNHLQTLNIQNCPNLICFPESGLPTTSLKSVWVNGCEKLLALPNLYSVQRLYIANCPRVNSIGNGCLPTSLDTLTIYEPNICKAVMEWGLHTLTSLERLEIDGSGIDVVSLPLNKSWLPPSLRHLCIHNFKNLRKLSNGFQNLTSLLIYNCSKLKSIPKKEVLPSLLNLCISNCPVLEERCKRVGGKQWSNIAHIPRVDIY